VVNNQVNILLVDDDVRNLNALESILAAPDCNLVRAVTGEQALLRLLEFEFAAIVLDIQMPDMSGIELAHLIKQRKRTQHIPIIFLTAFFQEDRHVLQGYDIGAVDYLTKPINPQILKSKIAVFVELFRKTSALAATNSALEQEIAQRQQAEEALRQAYNQLETRVQERTADLSKANEVLRSHEAALRESEAQAKAASRAKDDFLAALSHELRTPLNPVLLLATEAARDGRWSAEVRATFDSIAKNVALEARLIDDLLDLTRITRGKLTLEKHPVDVHVSLEEAFAMVREEIDAKRIAIALQLRAKRHAVLGDDVRLKQVFWNVIKNAAKFTPDGGRITIETSDAESSEELVVTITDTGIGMTPPELARLFEAFAQGDHVGQDRTHRFGGLGLGLAISRRMVELHSGTITASSPGRDRGATISIRFPLLPAGEPLPEAQVPEPPAVPPDVPMELLDWPRRILLVEDHKATSVALKYMLMRRNCSVVVASSLAEARDALRHEDFDVMISDIGLPDGTGHELMPELQGRNNLVGIALTGFGMEDDVNRSHAAGFVAHLTKPVSSQDLDQALVTASQYLSR
jgi:signal transduction histidine kinase